MRKMIKSLSVLVALSMVLSLCVSFAAVVSFGATVIEIDTAEELLKIGADAAYPIDGDYILTADIDLSQIVWTGIGGADGFSGTFDGDGHVIIGMHAGTPSAPYSLSIHAWGLFPVLLEGATVKNVAFKDVFFNGGYTSGTNTAIGTVCGYTKQDNVTIENVAVLSGSLTGTCKRQTRVGGILGVTRASNGTLIKNCYNAADVAGSYSSTGNCYISVGGIVGRYEGTKETSGLVNCFNAGKITALKTSLGSNYSSIGSIVALSNTTLAAQGDTANVVNCYTIKDLLDFDLTAPERISHFASDANGEKVKQIAGVVSGTAQSYSGLVSASDGAWTAKDGYYPMLTLFKDYAAVADADGDVEAYLKEVLEGIYVHNALSQQDVSDAVVEALGASFTVNTCTLALTQATASADGTYTINVAFTDGAKNYAVEVKGDFALPKIEYTFATDLPGRADGTVKITDTSYDANQIYELYWGTSSALLEGYSSIAKNQITVSGNVLTYEFPDLVAIPEKATHLWLVVNDILISSYAIPESRALDTGKLLYNYGVYSDVHFGDKNVPEYFTDAMNIFASASAVFAVSVGDFTDGGSEAQWKLFEDTYVAGGWKLPIWTCLGNHDILNWNLADNVTPAAAMANVKKAMNTYANASYVKDANDVSYKVTLSEKYPDYDYTVEYGDDLFVYMGIGAFRNDSAKNVDQHLALDQLKWLDGVLADYYNENDFYGHVYLIFHYYTMESGFGMYQNGSTSGTEWSRNMNGFMTSGYNSSEELYKILSKYPNVIHFSGHSHRSFERGNILSVTRQYIRLNDNGGYQKDDEALGYTAVHTPALSVSKEGYLVSVYENGILLTGYNFVENTVTPHATFWIENDSSVQLRENSDYVQFADGYGAWKNLIKSSDLKDAKGNAIELRADGENLQWKYEDSTEWKTVMPLADLTNADGVAAEMQISGNDVQIRYGSGAWKTVAVLQAPGTSDASTVALTVAAALSALVCLAVVSAKRARKNEQ